MKHKLTESEIKTLSDYIAKNNAIHKNNQSIYEDQIEEYCKEYDTAYDLILKYSEDAK